MSELMGKSSKSREMITFLRVEINSWVESGWRIERLLKVKGKFQVFNYYKIERPISA